MAVLWQFLCSLLLCGQPPLIYLTLLLSQCLCPSLACLSIIVATLPFLKLHISSLSWLLLCYRSNISLIIIIYVLMSIFYFFFYVEYGHPEEGTEFKRPLWTIFFLLVHQEMYWRKPLNIHWREPFASVPLAWKLLMWTTFAVIYFFSSAISCCRIKSL